MSGLLDFLSAEAGQRRTRARDEAIEDVFSWLLGPTGIPDRLNAIGLLNPVQDIYEAGGNARDGDYAGAAINTASALMPVVGAKLAGGGLADDAANIISDTLTNVGTRAQGAMDAGQAFAADEFGGVGLGKGIRAYHGSPHDFDRFSMDAIGTGEGAQAYGHGLYFAENEGVARGYRDALTPPPPTDDAIGQSYAFVQDMGGNKKLAAGTLRNTIDRGSPRYAISQQMADAIESGAIDNYTPPSGRMYEVNINANPDDFLDWDAPGPQQGEKVRKALTSIANSDPYVMRQFREAMERGDSGAIYEAILQDKTGNIVSNQISATQKMREAGIPGIKYLDQGSRGAGDGTRNFVVFDENLIEIVRKYGIAGAAAITGLSLAEIEGRMNGT